MNTLECNLAIAKDLGLTIDFNEWHLTKQRLYKVTADSLNIRKNPSATATVVGTLKLGDKVEVLDTIGTWARIDVGRWVSMYYLLEVI